jgi:hypothetical protein
MECNGIVRIPGERSPEGRLRAGRPKKILKSFMEILEARRSAI